MGRVGKPAGPFKTKLEESGTTNDSKKADVNTLVKNTAQATSAHLHWFAALDMKQGQKNINIAVMQKILVALQGNQVHLPQSTRPNDLLRLHGSKNRSLLINMVDNEAKVAPIRKISLEQLWLDSRYDSKFVYDIDSISAFLHAFGVVKDRVLVETLHDLLVKARRRRKTKWTPATYEVVMFAHCRLENWRAVKRLYEEYETLFNPFDQNVNAILLLEFYLTALQKSGSYDYITTFTSKHFKELIALKLSAESYSIILQECVRSGNLNMCQKWYTTIRKEVDGISHGDPSEFDKAEIDYTILYRALEAFSSLKSLDMTMQAFQDLKRIRRNFVKRINSKNDIHISPISMADLFDKLIRSEPYPLLHSEEEPIPKLEESEERILENYRTWISPLVPIDPLSVVLRTLSREKDVEMIYSFFQEQVCTKEYLALYWARQASTYKRNLISMVKQARESLELLKRGPSSALPQKLMSTKNWLKFVPAEVRNAQFSSSHDKATLKKEITWANQRMKRNLNLPALFGEKGPLRFCYESIVVGWRESSIANEGHELELENLMERLLKLERALVASVPSASFLSLKGGQDLEEEENKKVEN